MPYITCEHLCCLDFLKGISAHKICRKSSSTSLLQLPIVTVHGSSCSLTHLFIVFILIFVWQNRFIIKSEHKAHPVIQNDATAL